MGFLDDFDVDLNDFNDSGFDVPDGVYTFEVVKGELRKGTQKDSDACHIVITFSIENGDGETFGWNWWLKVPDDPARPTRRETIAMTDWKKWLLAAGFELGELSGVGPEDVEALTGSFRLVTGKPGKNGVAYQNPRDWSFDKDEEEAPAPVPKRRAKAAPTPEPEPEDDDEDEAPAPRRRSARSTAKANPFEK